MTIHGPINAMHADFGMTCMRPANADSFGQCGSDKSWATPVAFINNGIRMYSKD